MLLCNTKRSLRRSLMVTHEERKWVGLSRTVRDVRRRKG